GQASPYTGMAAPLIGAASGPQRNAMTLAIATGATARAARSGDIQLRLAGVSITDGSTALTRMCWGRSPSGRIWASRTTAALLVACTTGAGPVTAVFDPTKTIAPPSVNRLATACAVQSAEPKLDVNRLCTTSSVVSASLPGVNPPASPTSAFAVTGSPSTFVNASWTASREARSTGIA